MQDPLYLFNTQVLKYSIIYVHTVCGVSLTLGALVSPFGYLV